MARIPMVEYDKLSAEAKAEYTNQIKKHGKITNMKKTLLNDVLSFKVLMEWYPLRDKAAEFLGDFGVNVFCHAISSHNNCLICSTFFRKLLKDEGKNPDKLMLDDRLQTLVDYGRACVNQPTIIPDVLFDKMKKHFSDKEIVILTAFAGMMIATNLINNALEVELDDYLTSYTKR